MKLTSIADAPEHQNVDVAVGKSIVWQRFGNTTFCVTRAPRLQLGELAFGSEFEARCDTFMGATIRSVRHCRLIWTLRP